MSAKDAAHNFSFSQVGDQDAVVPATGIDDVLASFVKLSAENAVRVAFRPQAATYFHQQLSLLLVVHAQNGVVASHDHLPVLVAHIDRVQSSVRVQPQVNGRLLHLHLVLREQRRVLRRRRHDLKEVLAGGSVPVLNPTVGGDGNQNVLDLACRSRRPELNAVYWQSVLNGGILLGGGKGVDDLGDDFSAERVENLHCSIRVRSCVALVKVIVSHLVHLSLLVYVMKLKEDVFDLRVFAFWWFYSKLNVTENVLVQWRLFP